MKDKLAKSAQRSLIGWAYHRLQDGDSKAMGNMIMGQKSFFRHSNGNVSVVMALSVIPLLAVAGAAIDMVHANNAKTALQAAVDAATMAGGTSKITNQADMSILVEKYLASNDAKGSIDSMTSVDFGTVPATGNFYIKASGKMNTSFMGLVGYPTLDIGAYSEVEHGGNALELALVLDNTASMNSEGRLTALKASAKNLVNTLLTNPAPGAYIKIGIVPFSNYVNVGQSNRFKSWADVPADYTDTTAVTYTSYPNAVYSNCHLVDHAYTNDGVPAVWQENVCDVSPGSPVTSSYFPTHQWNGCIGSRNNPLDESVGAIGNKYPGIMDVGCPAPLTDLTDSKSTLNGQIDAMVANNETYIPAGLLWGWNMLDSAEPLTGAKSKAEMTALKGIKSLVLMTDGDNTLSATYPRHDGNDAAAADAKTAQLCENIKAEGISVYTVGFKVTKPSSVNMLTACASNTTQAYTAADDTALAAAFSEIAATLAQMRVAK